MAKPTVPHRRFAEQLSVLLDSPEVASLIAELEATRWTGRPGYPIRAMVGMALVKSLYVLPTWTRTVALVAEHAALRDAIGDAPSVYACYRFAAKLRQFKPLLDACIASVLSSLHDEVPEFGEHVAIDGSDLPAYANGQRFVSKGGRLRVRFSDPDASWGAPLVHLHSEGRRLLRLRAARRGLHHHRPSGGVGDAHGPSR